jgi:hypothetical protein
MKHFINFYTLNDFLYNIFNKTLNFYIFKIFDLLKKFNIHFYKIKHFYKKFKHKVFN